MPTLPTFNKCAHYGCKAPRARYGGGYCIEHGGRDTYACNDTDERKAFNSLYQTPYWKRTRMTQLSRQPLCQACLARGIVTPAIHVDHLFPWRGLGREAFYTNVLQSLCHSCHSDKTLLEKRGVCRFYNGESITDYAISEYKAVVSGAYTHATL